MGTQVMHQTRHQIIENTVTILVAFCLAAICLISSPLHPWVNECAGTDSSVFKTVAMMMERGYMPYRDSFDHKGPLLYVLNYLGNEISYYSGIWIIELISLTLTIAIMYKIARLSCSVMAAIITSLFALSLFFVYFEGGNLVEEYAMPCIAFSVFVFLDYFLNEKLTKWRVLLSGMSLGIVLFLRPNMIAVWLVFCSLTLFELLRSKEYDKLVRIMAAFICGLCIMVLPFAVWLAVNRTAGYFWSDYIVFNRQYISTMEGRVRLYDRWVAIKNFSKTYVYSISLLSVLISLRERQRRSINVAYLIYLVLTVSLIALSGRQYGHYGMIIIPAVIYPLSILFKSLESIKSIRLKKVMTTFVGVLCLCFIMSDWTALIKKIPSIYANKGKKPGYELNDIITLIDEKTKSTDTISVYGNWDIIYVLSRRKHATRYSYQFPIGQVEPQIMKDYFEQLQLELPKVIVIKDSCVDEDITRFIILNNYTLAWSGKCEGIQIVFVYMLPEVGS